MKKEAEKRQIHKKRGTKEARGKKRQKEARGCDLTAWFTLPELSESSTIFTINFYSDNYDLLLNKVDEFTENIENIALHRLQTVKKLLNINSEENIFFGNNIEKYYSEIN